MRQDIHWMIGYYWQVGEYPRKAKDNVL